MSCCGNRSRAAVVVPRSGNGIVQAQAAPTLAVFRYDGTRSISVFGKVTGTRYRFAGKGAEVAVDIRDRSGVRGVPGMVELRVV